MVGLHVMILLLASTSRVASATDIANEIQDADINPWKPETIRLTLKLKPRIYYFDAEALQQALQERLNEKASALIASTMRRRRRHAQQQ
ncbi:unnamed protein product [Gongylonema pulchrum]|uniref:Mechanosensitive ion channel family protein n=1 Tax=Gongylonema pulchrum TaxID=637853 RepID=A0A183E393_9BILA|nr:unnamed protein product [Gongylonema pulchrum]